MSRGPELSPSCCPGPCLGNSTAVKLMVAKDLLRSSEALTPRMHLLSSSDLSFNNAANIISHLCLVRSALCLAVPFVSHRHLEPFCSNRERLWLLKLITYPAACVIPVTAVDDAALALREGRGCGGGGDPIQSGISPSTGCVWC